MTENDNVQVSGIESKFMKVTLTVVAVLLMFVGPTYIQFLLADILHIDYIATIVAGGALFVVGLLMLIYLVGKKVLE